METSLESSAQIYLAAQKSEFPARTPMHKILEELEDALADFFFKGIVILLQT